MPQYPQIRHKLSAKIDEIRKLLEGLDINRLTPVEALLKIQEIKNLLK